MTNMTPNAMAALVAQATEAQSKLEAMVGIPAIDEATFASDFELAKAKAAEARERLNALSREADSSDAQNGFALIDIAIHSAEVRMRFERFKIEVKS